MIIGFYIMNILISLLGSTLDGNGKARGLSRWNVWRPSVALAMQNDLHFDRYHLIYHPKFEGLKERIVEDIKQCSPSTGVIPEAVFMDDPWDFEEVYSKMSTAAIRIFPAKKIIIIYI